MEQLKALKVLKWLGDTVKGYKRITLDDGDLEIIQGAIAELEALQSPKTCEWSMDDPDWGTYKTKCGQFFNVIDGDLKDNTIKYCTYCGGLISEIKET